MTKNHIAPKITKVEIRRLVKRMRRRPMRDPARIAGMLKALEKVWRKDPDLRLGQIIVNAIVYIRPSFECPAAFYIEDDEMLKGIEQLAMEPRKNKGSRPVKRGGFEFFD